MFLSLIFIKVAVWGAFRVFSCEICEIFENVFFKEHFPATAFWLMFLSYLSSDYDDTNTFWLYTVCTCVCH